MDANDMTFGTSEILLVDVASAPPTIALVCRRDSQGCTQAAALSDSRLRRRRYLPPRCFPIGPRCFFHPRPFPHGSFANERRKDYEEIHRVIADPCSRSANGTLCNERGSHPGSGRNDAPAPLYWRVWPAVGLKTQ